MPSAKITSVMVASAINFSRTTDSDSVGVTLSVLPSAIAVGISNHAATSIVLQVFIRAFLSFAKRYLNVVP